MRRRAALAAVVLAGVVACGGGSLPDLPYVEGDAAMEKTILMGTTVYGQPVPADGVHRGDIVVLRGPAGWGVPSDAFTIQRVLAVGGDSVSCCDAQNRLMVDDQPVREGYMYFGPGRGTHQSEFARLVVPEGQLWLMGDNRNESRDSRAPGRGAVPADAVVAVVTGTPASCPPAAVSCPSADRTVTSGDHHPRPATTTPAPPTN